MDVLMPQLGETVAEGTVTQWYKQVGDAVTESDLLFDVETDKVATEIPSPATGILAEILVPVGQTVSVGTRLAVIRVAGETAASATSQVAAAPSQAAATGTLRGADHAPASTRVSREDVTAGLSPVVRRLIAEHDLDPAAIVGSGRDGRVTREDVLAHVGRQGAASGSPSPDATSHSPPSRPPAVGSFETVQPLNSVRRRSAAALAKSWTTIPHVLQAVEVDFHGVDEARARRGAAWKQAEGFALTYLPFIAHAVCRALAKYPRLNARLDGDNLILSSRVNLGIAVELGDEGLIVPVVKDAQDKAVTAIAREVHGLAAKARTHQLRPDDLTEATYTLSNSGVFGTLITAAIINPPQVAILSTDGVRKKPVVVEGRDGDRIDIRPVGVLAQSFDHRAVDGAYSAAFLREVKSILETHDWSGDLSA